MVVRGEEVGVLGEVCDCGFLPLPFSLLVEVEEEEASRCNKDLKPVIL